MGTDADVRQCRVRRGKASSMPEHKAEIGLGGNTFSDPRGARGETTRALLEGRGGQGEGISRRTMAMCVAAENLQ